MYIPTQFWSSTLRLNHLYLSRLQVIASQDGRVLWDGGARHNLNTAHVVVLESGISSQMLLVIRCQ